MSDRFRPHKGQCKGPWNPISFMWINWPNVGTLHIPRQLVEEPDCLFLYVTAQKGNDTTVCLAVPPCQLYVPRGISVCLGVCVPAAMSIELCEPLLWLLCAQSALLATYPSHWQGHAHP